jgi:RimJ/RimL family protein N-acetyltransferase
MGPQHTPAPRPWIEPVTLEGRRVRLEPLSLAHLDDLADVGLDPAIWRWTIARPGDRAGLATWIGTAVAAADARTELPFATIDRASGRAIGSTRFMSVAPEHRRLEIGWTRVTPAAQGSGANTEAKYLQLRHAFEVLGANRVEFKTHASNVRARGALARIGGTFEGVFRDHMVMPEGPLRDSAWYSVIVEAWPAVRAALEGRLNAADAAG